jgi:murein DD-endopeptidase MepM/ murein hydrolase activator NlpD
VVGPDVRVLASRALLEGVAARLDLAEAQVDELETQARDLAADLGALWDQMAAAERRLDAFERTRERRRDRAAEVVATGTVPGRPETPETLADLRAPLVVVNAAIHANDRLGIALLAERAEAERRVARLRAFLAALDRAQAHLAVEEHRVRAELARAIAAVSAVRDVAGGTRLAAEAEALLARARDQLGRIARARAELRARQAEVVAEAASLRARIDRIERDLRGVRAADRELTQEMTVAELLVASRLATFSGDLGGVRIAIEGVLRVCPVDEPMSYTDNWHAPRWTGGFHLHEGIDIFAPWGTPIRAPFDGTAVPADNPLGGIAVKVYGETGYVYNAHLSAYGQLGQVHAGDVIGYVGSTGDASGPHDHFEYHPGNGEAVNPFPFLNAVC